MCTESEFWFSQVTHLYDTAQCLQVYFAVLASVHLYMRPSTTHATAVIPGHMCTVWTCLDQLHACYASIKPYYARRVHAAKRSWSRTREGKQFSISSIPKPSFQLLRRDHDHIYVVKTWRYGLPQEHVLALKQACSLVRKPGDG